jgi:hypothetical protein
MVDHGKAYQRIIARCWADPAFKEALLADPVATLAQEGVLVPPGVRVQVVESTAEQRWLVIPPCPTDLSDEELDGVAGGGSSGCSVDDGLCHHDTCGWFCDEPR